MKPFQKHIRHEMDAVKLAQYTKQQNTALHVVHEDLILLPSTALFLPTLAAAVLAALVVVLRNPILRKHARKIPVLRLCFAPVPAGGDSDFSFEDSVQQIRSKIRRGVVSRAASRGTISNGNGSGSSSSRLLQQQDPISGVYSLRMREYEIALKKTGEILHKGSENESTVTLHFDADQDNQQQQQQVQGWSIKGRRVINTTGGGFFAIEDGYVARATGQAYWVERGRDISVLACGTFQESYFEGEWLNSKGERGRYDEFGIRSRVEVSMAIPLSQPFRDQDGIDVV